MMERAVTLQLCSQKVLAVAQSLRADVHEHIEALHPCSFHTPP